MLRAIILATALVAGVGAVAYAASEAEHPQDYKFTFESPTGSYDMAAVQRGFLVYSQVCSTCHSMKHLAYRSLGERGGPFAMYRVRNHETGEMENRIGLPAGEHGEFVEVTDNPYVRAIAQAVTIPDIDQNTGTETDRPGRISDHFRRPFANEYAARAANGGALPPDLSEIVLARHGGADYVRSILIGYTGETRGAQHVNRYFPGGLISMPPPLHEGAVTFTDGTNATVEQQATDVANFLQWAADPHMEARKTLGFQVIGFLIALSLLLFLAYKQVWKGESH